MERLKPNVNKGVPAKIDLGFDNFLEEIAIERIKKDLEKEILPKRELTRMFMITEHLKDIKFELINKPRKKNE